MILTLDVENTVTKRNGKMHLDPFEPDNTLVMVGMLDDHMNETIVTFDHAEQQPTTDGRRIVQDALDSTRLLVAHNAPHDLVWLWESGFTYDGDIFDTMLGEYVLQRGQKEHCHLRHVQNATSLTLRSKTHSKNTSSKACLLVTYHTQSCLSICHMTYMLRSNCSIVCRRSTRSAVHWNQRSL